MGKKNTATADEQGNIFERKMDRREAIGWVLKLLGLKVAADATDAMWQDKAVAAVTKTANSPLPQNLNTEQLSEASLLFRTDYKKLEDLTLNPFQDQRTEVSSEIEKLWPDFSPKLEQILARIYAKEQSILAEQVSAMKFYYPLVKTALMRQEEACKTAFAGERDQDKKDAWQVRWDMINADLKTLEEMPEKFQTPWKDKLTALKILILLSKISKKHSLPLTQQVNVISKSVTPEIAEIKSLGNTLETKIKEKRSREISYKPSDVVIVVPNLLKGFLSPKNEEVPPNIEVKMANLEQNWYLEIPQNDIKIENDAKFTIMRDPANGIRVSLWSAESFSKRKKMPVKIISAKSNNGVTWVVAIRGKKYAINNPKYPPEGRTSTIVSSTTWSEWWKNTINWDSANEIQAGLTKNWVHYMVIDDTDKQNTIIISTDSWREVVDLDIQVRWFAKPISKK